MLLHPVIEALPLPFLDPHISGVGILAWPGIGERHGRLPRPMTLSAGCSKAAPVTTVACTRKMTEAFWPLEIIGRKAPPPSPQPTKSTVTPLRPPPAPGAGKAR